VSRTALAPLVLAVALLLATPAEPAAHEIPPDVTVRMLVRPDGDRLRVLLRVPVEALRDVELGRRGPDGWLDPPRATTALWDAARTWLADYVEVLEGGTRVGDPAVTAVRVSLPSDRSFADWYTALSHVTGPPLRDDTRLAPEHAVLDVLLDYPVRSEDSDFALVSGLAHLGIRTTTVLRYWAPDGTDRTVEYTGDPGTVRLDPRWHHAALRFVALGFEHILGGFDHILFLLVLVAPYRRATPLVPVVTAFTVAHSVTLGAAALGLVPTALWFGPLVETLIAASVVWMALENVIGASLHRRWAVAFAFGLVHGFGFSFILGRTLQFAGGHLLTGLLAFNVGVELGQLLVLLLAVPLLGLLAGGIARARPAASRMPARRIASILVSVLLAHSAWHWMVTRGGALLEHDIRWPPVDLFLVADVMRWSTLALAAAGAAWLTGALFRRLARRLPSLLAPAGESRPG
jgi:hypothetical protein